MAGTNLLTEFLFGESLRGTKFNMREFESLLNGKENFPTVEKAKILRDYVESKGLQKVGEGSSRTAYVLSSRFALKLAGSSRTQYVETYTEAGAAQNQQEFNTWRDAPPTVKAVIPESYRLEPVDGLWLIADLVRPLKNIEEFFELSGGLHPTSLSSALQSYYSNSSEEDYGRNSTSRIESRKKVEAAVKKNKTAKRVYKGLQQAVSAFKLDPADFGGIRQWGKTALGKIVLLDYGASNEIIDTFYS